ncbi:response regulator transcription factor [soil metagenome]|jgi:DNA-binding NarL/FixJ family response regulator
MIRIAIVEDNQLFRDDLKIRIDKFPELKVVLVSSNGKEFIKEIKKRPPDIMPEVVLMDIAMSEMDGITATAIAKTIHPQMHILMLTFSVEEERIFSAIKAGISGYLLKEESPESIVKAIHEVKKGYSYMSPAIARYTLDILREEISNNFSPKRPERVRQPNTPLTKRELEVLELVAKGLSYGKVAETSFISEQTVKKHVRNIYEKLQVKNKIEATQIAVNNNWFKK